jgi:hypothetical protein
MAAAVPIIAGISAASSVKSAVDARKGQKEQLAQQERLAAETRAQTPQLERNAEDMFARRKVRKGPGFSPKSDPMLGGGTESAYLGQ